MKETERKQFMDLLYYGEEIVLNYGMHKFFIQGYQDGDKMVENVDDWLSDKDAPVWHVEAGTAEETRELFLKARIFDGRTFEEAFDQIEWTEDWRV